MLQKLKNLFSTSLFSAFSMPYASAAAGNSHLVDRLVKQGIVKSPEVEAVMKAVDRGDFASYDAYSDRPQPIGFQATISAPHMHAFALEYLKDNLIKGKKALDVGSGSGYLTVCFAKLMENPEAVAYGVEHIPELVKESKQNIMQSSNRDLLENGKVVIVEGDGRLGLEKFAPYDAIHVGAGATEIPRKLLEQLAYGGRMLIPVGRFGEQDFLVIDKDEKGKITKKKVLDVMYVPLTDRDRQCPR